MMRNLLQRNFQSAKQLPAALEQPDKLEAEDILPIASGHSGVPEASDALAYDPVQRLLAVGTSDGRVKVVGREGVEAAIPSLSSTGTRHLQFLPNRGAVLRVNQEGDVQLFGLEDAGLLDNMPVEGDTVTAAAALAADPYLLLGCASGAVRVASLLGADGQPAEAARPLASVEVKPYTVSPEQMCGSGAVVGLALHESGKAPREQRLLLVVHEHSGVAVWDVRRQKLVAVAPNADQAGGGVGPAACACWVGDHGKGFATGHPRGLVRLWSVPAPEKDSVAEDDDGSPAPPTAVLRGMLCVSRRAGGDNTAGAVRKLQYVGGNPVPSGEALLALGGQPEDKPDCLSLLPLPSQVDNSSRPAQELPWFGAVEGWALLPPKGAATASEDPVAILVLAQGGQLMVHDLRSGVPVPFSLPFQELSPVSRAELVEPAQQPLGSGGAPPHAVTLDSLQVAALTAPRPAGGAAWRYILSGGAPPPPPPPGARHPSALLLTGHRDGRARVWDATCEVPRLLTTAPFDAGGQTGRLRTVTSLEVCCTSGLLAVGHQQGAVRVYQFSALPHDISQVELTRGAPPAHTTTPQPPGWQCLLHAALNAADITAIALASAHGLLATGDGAGGIVVVDLLQPSALWGGPVADSPIAGLAMAPLPPPTNGRRTSWGLGGPPQARLALFAVNAEGGSVVLDARTGEPFGAGGGGGKAPWMTPKKASEAMGLQLLGAEGTPAAPPAGEAHLIWANNAEHAAETPRLSDFSPRAPEAAQQPQQEWQPPPQITTAPTDAQSPLGSSPHDALSPHSQQHTPLSPDGSQWGDPSQASPYTGTTEAGSGRRSEEHHRALSPSSSHRSIAEDPGGVGGTSDSGISSDESSSEDEDDLLAAAVAAIETKGKKKSRSGKHFMRRKIKGAKAASSLKAQVTDAMTHQGEHYDEQGGTPGSARAGGAIATGRMSRIGRASDEDNGSARAIDPTTQSFPPHVPHPPSPPPPHLQQLRMGPGSESGGPHSTVSSPIALSSPGTSINTTVASPTAARAAEAAAAAVAAVDMAAGAAATPAFVLLMTRQFLRLYTPEGIRTGDRTSLRRAVMAEGLVHAAAFATSAGPGVAALTYSGNLLVYALPSLEPLAAAPLQRALGFPFCAEVGSSQVALAGVSAVSRDGHTLLISPAGEVVRLTLGANLERPSKAASMFDWDVAAAAHAAAEQVAAAAVRKAQRREEPPPAPSAGLNKAMQARLEAAETAGSGGGGGITRRATMGGAQRPGSRTTTSRSSLSVFLNSMKDVTTKVINETEKGVQGIGAGVQGLARELGGGFQRGPPPPPTVTQVFEGRVPVASSPQASGDLSDERSDCSPATSQRRLEAAQESLPTEYPAPPPLRGSGDSSPYYQGNDEARGALFSGARRGAGGSTGRPSVRSAAEIRAAYGRPAQSAVHSQAAQNREALAERGAKLKGLGERTERMEADALDFASMAKQIAARERDKKWWQM